MKRTGRVFRMALLFSLLGVLFGLLSRALATEPAGRPDYALSDTVERVVVFIASSDCSGVRMPGVVGYVNDIVDNERHLAKQLGEAFVAVGVAIDPSVDDGIRLLSRFREDWDEVVVGRGWLNTAVRDYVWEGIPGHAGIPQVLVVRRSVRLDGGVRIESEEILSRRAGGVPIKQWAERIQIRDEVG